MIYIGCTGFEEHQLISGKTKTSLYDYARYFPVVELDTSFYFTPTERSIQKWLKETPETFRFILKLPGLFTTHHPLKEGQTLVEEANLFLERIKPLQQNNRLFCVLAQFPATFTCTSANVQYLEEIRKLFQKLPLAIEFRHRSWYDIAYKQKMYRFLYAQQFSLAVVDEPKKLPTTIPLDETITNQEFVLCRFHGRNDAGWMHTGKDARKVRTLYRYSDEEIESFAQMIQQLKPNVKQIAVIFNNNSGGDAAENAQMLQQALDISYTDLHPTQLDLF